MHPHKSNLLPRPGLSTHQPTSKKRNAIKLQFQISRQNREQMAGKELDRCPLEKDDSAEAFWEISPSIPGISVNPKCDHAEMTK
jgi:hypothetical protein